MEVIPAVISINLAIVAANQYSRYYLSCLPELYSWAGWDPTKIQNVWVPTSSIMLFQLRAAASIST